MERAAPPLLAGPLVCIWADRLQDKRLAPGEAFEESMISVRHAHDRKCAASARDRSRFRRRSIPSRKRSARAGGSGNRKSCALGKTRDSGSGDGAHCSPGRSRELSPECRLSGRSAMAAGSHCGRNRSGASVSRPINSSAAAGRQPGSRPRAACARGCRQAGAGR